jgi:hypothetical protein
MNVMLIVQVAAGATDAPHVFVWAKSPVAVMTRLSAPLPLFVTVIVCAALVEPNAWAEKVRVASDRLTTGTVPVPDKVMTWGPPDALSVRVTDPERAPAVEGVNVMLRVQLAPAATEPPQVFLCAKLPVAAMLEILSVAPPPLIKIMSRGVLVVPTARLPKVILEAVKVAAAAGTAGGGGLPPPHEDR